MDAELARLSTAYYADDRFVDAGRQWGLQDAETWRGFADFLAEAGLTEGVAPTDDAWTNDFLPQP